MAARAGAGAGAGAVGSRSRKGAGGELGVSFGARGAGPRVAHPPQASGIASPGGSFPAPWGFGAVLPRERLPGHGGRAVGSGATAFPLPPRAFPPRRDPGCLVQRCWHRRGTTPRAGGCAQLPSRLALRGAGRAQSGGESGKLWCVPPGVLSL